MPHWSNSPPDPDRGAALPLRRTPAQGSLLGVITSDDLIGTITHFWKGRTIPCEHPTCEPCSEGMPWRWHAYFGLWLPVADTHCLVEVTAQIAEKLTRIRQMVGTLRGQGIKLDRPSKRPNGRVVLYRWPNPPNDKPLPPPPNVIAALSTIWNLAETQLTVPDTLRLMPHLTHTTTRHASLAQATPKPSGNGDETRQPTTTSPGL